MSREAIAWLDRTLPLSARFPTTAADGKSYRTRYYNLDAIIAVGYRVNKHQAMQFRMRPKSPRDPATRAGRRGTHE